jgi:alpha-mannosidase
MKERANGAREAFQQAAGTAGHWMDRFQAEMDFARFLCERQPGRAAAWRRRMAGADERVAKAAATGDARRIAQAVREAEAFLAPLAAAAKSYTVYCVGHAHIDMNWMWSWPETVAVTNDTFGTVLKLMDEFPQFRFSQSQASVYAILERYHPDLLARVARRVREGRWEVTASHWVENDKNMAGPESLCRHLLHTRAYMKDLFGLSPEDVPIDWSPDTFGHAATVPTYLVRGGVKYLYLHRPGAEGPKRPAAFWWRAPDGSRVLTRNDMAFGYNGVLAPENLLASLRVFTGDTGLPLTLYVYGVGDHGGGPTRRDLLRGLDMATWPLFPEVRFSTAREFFEQLERRGRGLPVLEHELNFELAGCYTTQTLIKKGNRIGENRLTDAETLAGLTWAALGRPYPAPALREGWRDILFNHFHDILPGSGVHDTRTYAHGLFQKTMAATSMEETLCLRLLASQVDTSGAAPAPADGPASRVSSGLGAGAGYGSANGVLSAAEQSAGQGDRPFLVFNPTAWERGEIVEATIWDNPAPGQPTPLRNRRFAARFANGTQVPAQTVNTGGYWGHDFVTVAFPVKVPALGYATATVVEVAGGEAASGVSHIGRTHHCSYSKHEREPEGLENAFLRMEVDMVTGGIRSLADKRSGAILIAPERPAPVLEYGVEVPHGMTAWLVDHQGAVEYAQLVAVTRRLAGPHKASLDVKLRVKESDFTLTYEVRADDPHLYLHLAGTWFQRGTPQTGIPVLRMAFPFALDGARGRYEIPFGAIDRPHNRGQEVPALQWAQVTGRAGGRRAGCLVLNDSKYGHSLDGSTLRVSLIRSSYDPDPLPEIGQHEVHVALRPFAGALPVSAAARAGRALNHALRVMGTDVHAGRLPAGAGLVSVSPANAVLHCLKKAEQGDALVLILAEPDGKATRATVDLNARLLGRVREAVEVDLLERPVVRSSARVRGNRVSVRLPARGIASVLVRLERSRRAGRRAPDTR